MSFHFLIDCFFFGAATMALLAASLTGRLGSTCSLTTSLSLYLGLSAALLALYEAGILTWLQDFVCAAILAAIIWWPTPQSPIKMERKVGFELALAGITGLTVFGIVYGFTNFSTGPTADLIHHYDPFLFYNYATRDGLAPYYDFPLQYGFGPYLISVAFAKSLGSIFLITCIFNAALSTILFAILATHLRTNTRLICAAALVISWMTFGNCGSAHLGSTSSFYPAIGGLRYVPIVAVFLSLSRDWPRPVILALVAFASFWSFEAGLLSLIALGGNDISLRKWRGALLSAWVYLAGIVISLIVSRLVFGRLDIGSYFCFLGNRNLSNFETRYWSLTLLAIAISLMALRPDGASRVAIACLLGASIYPFLRGQPATILLNAAPLFLVILLAPNWRHTSPMLLIFFAALGLLPVLGVSLHYSYDPSAAIEGYRKMLEEAEMEEATRVHNTLHCDGLYIAGTGVPLPGQRYNLDAQYSVWGLLAVDTTREFQRRIDADLRRHPSESQYCWIDMLQHYPFTKKVAVIAKQNGLQFSSAYSQRVLLTKVAMH